MMKMNNRLYQYIIILFALGNAPFVLASESGVDNKKEQAEMPPAPLGPYRAQSENNKAKQTVNIMQRSVPAMPAQQLSQRPPQAQWNQPPPQQMRRPVAPPAWVNQVPPQQRMAPNRNRNIPPQAQWNQPPPQQMRRPVAPPAWTNQMPPQQRMAPNWNRNVSPQPQWQRPKVPEWVTNPPAWVTNPAQQPMYPYGNRGRY